MNSFHQLSNSSILPSVSLCVIAAAAAVTAAAVVSAYLLTNKSKGDGSNKGMASAEPPMSGGGGGPAETSIRKKSYLLAGDIGGTNSRMALYSPSSKVPLLSREYQNERVLNSPESTFEGCVVIPFLRDCFATEGIERGAVTACFACAGPVLSNRVVMTNIKVEFEGMASGTKFELVIDGPLIERSMDGELESLVRVKLVNDFVGLGYGLVDLDLSEGSEEIVELSPGSRELMSKEEAATGPKACVGAGTGLGECYLTCSSLNPSGGYECYPSEGGHTEFAPRTALEIEMLKVLKSKFDSKSRVSVERVVSGKGLANIYEFLAGAFPDKVDEKIHAEFLSAGDLQGKVLGINASRDGGSPLCVQAMEIMMSAYGSEVGSAALKYIPTGGMFVTGGLTPKNLSWLTEDDSPFMVAYKDKGRVSAVLDTVPLFAVLAEDLGLRGARVCALRVRFVPYHLSWASFALVMLNAFISTRLNLSFLYFITILRALAHPRLLGCLQLRRVLQEYNNLMME